MFEGVCLLRYFHASEVPMSVISAMSAGAPEEQEPMDTAASRRKDADESNGSNVQIKFEEICQGLNLDKQAQEKAWDSYMRLSEKYGLEVRTRPCDSHVTHLPTCNGVLVHTLQQERPKHVQMTR